MEFRADSATGRSTSTLVSSDVDGLVGQRLAASRKEGGSRIHKTPEFRTRGSSRFQHNARGRGAVPMKQKGGRARL